MWLTPYQCCNRAERDSGGGFFAGVLVGGAIFGALGYLFAPQISKALLSDDQRLKLPRFLEEEKKSPEATKQVMLSQSMAAQLAMGCCTVGGGNVAIKLCSDGRMACACKVQHACMPIRQYFKQEESANALSVSCRTWRRRLSS
jgi:hypothetical protein